MDTVWGLGCDAARPTLLYRAVGAAIAASVVDGSRGAFLLAFSGLGLAVACLQERLVVRLGYHDPCIPWIWRLEVPGLLALIRLLLPRAYDVGACQRRGIVPLLLTGSTGVTGGCPYASETGRNQLLEGVERACADARARRGALDWLIFGARLRYAGCSVRRWLCRWLLNAAIYEDDSGTVV